MTGVLLNLLVGAVLGFLGSIPVAGPISVIVLALAVDKRFRTALAVAAGGALGEAVYAFLAFWGLSRYLLRYPALLEASRGITALILMIIGVVLMLQKRSSSQPESSPKNRSGSGFFLGFTISILNPTFLLTWVAASSVVFSVHLLRLHPAEALPFSLGVCSGIISWFALLLWIVARYQDRFRPSILNRIVFWMGGAVFMGGAGLLLMLLRNLPV